MKDVPNSDLFYSDLLVSGVHSTFKIVFPFYFIAVQPGFSVLLQHFFLSKCISIIPVLGRRIHH